jgi:hypothetical protein
MQQPCYLMRVVADAVPEDRPHMPLSRQFWHHSFVVASAVDAALPCRCAKGGGRPVDDGPVTLALPGLSLVGNFVDAILRPESSWWETARYVLSAAFLMAAAITLVLWPRQRRASRSSSR